jgi:hypothetical protein
VQALDGVRSGANQAARQRESAADGRLEQPVARLCNALGGAPFLGQLRRLFGLKKSVETLRQLGITALMCTPGMP